jgi:hypothetical protein
LLSYDTGPLASAKSVGVAFTRIPDEWLLQIESDSDEKALKSLQQELQRYKYAEPRFDVVFEGVPWNFRVQIHRPLSDGEVSMLMSKLRGRFAVETDFGSRNPVEEIGTGVGLSAAFGRKFIPASDESIRNYQENAYPKWLATCEEALRSIHQKLDAKESGPVIRVSVRNVGSRPAEDAQIVFESKGCFGLIAQKTESDDSTSSADEEVRLPLPPSPPRGFWRKVDFPRIGALGSVVARPIPMDIGRLHLPKPPDPNCFYWRGGRPSFPKARQELTCKQWRHHVEPELFEFDLRCKWKLGTNNGAIAVAIHAGNLTEPHFKSQKVRVEVVEVDTFALCEQLVESLSEPVGRFVLSPTASE